MKNGSGNQPADTSPLRPSELDSAVADHIRFKAQLANRRYRLYKLPRTTAALLAGLRACGVEIRSNLSREGQARYHRLFRKYSREPDIDNLINRELATTLPFRAFQALL